LRAQELLIVLLIVLLVFVARKLPDLARSLGSSAKEFRKGLADGAGEGESEVSAADANASEPPAAEAQASDAPKPDS
jgi:sec-independent protein translocase protein TatA